MIPSGWRSQIFEEKKSPILGPTVINQAQNEVLRLFLEFGSLVFLEIAYYDSLYQCLTSSRAKKKLAKKKKKNWGPHLGQTLGFSLFSQVWFISFPWKWYNDSLQQCLTSSRGKTHKKYFFEAHIWTTIGPEIRFSTIFSSLVNYFSFKLHRVIAWNNNWQLAEVKSIKKIGGPNLGQTSQNQFFFAIYLSLVH